MVDKKSSKNSKSSSNSKDINHWMYVAVIFIIIAIIEFVLLLPSPSNAGSFVSAADDDAILGDPKAPVEIVEFSDYQCPFCKKFWSETLPQIKSEYIDTGKVKLIFRDFPLANHPGAKPAAEAAECVRDLGGDAAYYQMHDAIFLSASTFSSDELKGIASTLGYDISSCLDSGKFSSEVSADLADGQRLGIRGTPGFLINGQLVNGAQPFSVFKEVIDAELS